MTYRRTDIPRNASTCYFSSKLPTKAHCPRRNVQHLEQQALRRQGKGYKVNSRPPSLVSDPDAYSLESDPAPHSEDGRDEESSSGSNAEETPPANLSLIRRVNLAFKTAVHTVASAPRESWNSVKVTAGAATALLLDPAARSIQDSAAEVHEEAPPSSHGYAHDGPVGRARERWKEARNEMPEGAWGKIQWIWDQPPVKKLRITITAAQWSFRLPAILALLATQGGLLASQVSLPLLAPLLLGTGMMLRGIRSNASIIFPRICVLVVLLYVLWFFNSVVQNTVVYLRRQGAVDARVSGAIITASECCALLAAMIIVLSMIGVNVSGLLLPAGIALAYAAKDLSHNFLAGFFLFAVQPFKLGDRISVSYTSAAAANPSSRTSWFEGTCEKVDLRYTVVKNGPRSLFVPNQAFLTREFIVMDDSDSPKSSSKRDLFPPELAGNVEPDPRQQAYNQSMQQQPQWHEPPPMQQQYNWGQQGYEERMSQPGVGPSQPNPSGPNSPPMRQWSGTGWQYQPSQQYPPQPGVNPREWQRMQQGGLSSQKPPDRDHQQEGEVKVNQGNDRRNG